MKQFIKNVCLDSTLYDTTLVNSMYPDKFDFNKLINKPRLRDAVREVCLNGPRVINGMAPTKKAFNTWLSSEISKTKRSCLTGRLVAALRTNADNNVFKFHCQSELTGSKVSILFIQGLGRLKNLFNLPIL